MQQLLISLSHAAVSHFAPLKTMKGGNFVPSAFAVRQTETRVFLCPAVFTVTVFFMCQTIPAQMGISSIAIISAALYECFMTRRWTCKTKDSNLSMS